MQITIAITGAGNIQSKLKRLGEGLYHLHDSMVGIGQYLSRFYADEVINSRGQAIGVTWAPLNPKYKLYKAQGATHGQNKGHGGYPGGPEVKTGLMRNSFTFDATNSGVNVGNLQEYFKYQELGTSRGLPARRMMGFNTNVKREIADILRTEIQRKIDAA